MKKWISLLIAMALVWCCGAALAETGIANPWTETTGERLMEALGLQLGVPEDATNVTWRMLEAEQMGELQCNWNDVALTARVAPSDDFQDISGMYYEWQHQEACAVGRCDGVVSIAEDGENTVETCLWYDALTGLMYSVSAVDTDLDGFDIVALAEQVYVPMQTE